MNASSLPLSSLVSVRERYARSVHLERDAQRSFAGQFHLTESARKLLESLVQGLRSPADRALTVVGPYGAGKSACCLFAAQLLEGSGEAMGKLREGAPALADALKTRSIRLVPVPIVGARQALGTALVSGLLRALKTGAHAALRARIGAEANRLLALASPTPREIANLFSLAARTARELGSGGLLVILDELGKVLEHAALHPEDGDIFILQELGEAAARSGDTPLLVVGVMHQQPEAYAQKLGRSQQAEWSKVGERFRSVPFFPSDLERIDMVGKALRHDRGIKLNGHVTGLCEQYATLELPTGGLERHLPDLARKAYPLHPLTLIALPALFRRVGQSHRSLFNFLASEEPHALGVFLREQVYEPDAPPFYALDRLFDYAAEVLSVSWYGSGLTRQWSEAVESVEKASRLPDLELRLLKCIALLGILKEQRLPASPRLLALAVRGCASDSDVSEALERLERERRLVRYSRQRQGYILWEAGDVDVEAELRAARPVGTSGAALHVAAKVCPPKRLVARRHSYETGTLRRVDVRVCAGDRLNAAIQEAGRDLTLIYCLVAGREEEETARRVAANCVSPNVLMLLARETEALREAAADLTAADHVERQNDAIRNDRAARRELAARREEAERAFTSEWERLFRAEPEVEKWWRSGQQFSIDGERQFAQLLSEMAASVYHASPHLRNELINRRQVSSAAAAGRRSLIEAMLSRAEEPDLGIQQFPPELSMYQCLLAATGLHGEIEPGRWGFRAPVESGRGSLRPVWLHLERRVFGPTPEPVPLTDLYQELVEPPFGLTEGVLPILLCAFLRVNDHEITAKARSWLNQAWRIGRS